MTTPQPTKPRSAKAEPAKPRLPSEAEVERVLLAIAAGEPGHTVDPSEPARTLYTAAPDWQRALPVIRRVAVRLAREGRLGIYRKGRPVDPEEFRGVYRLGPPPAP